MARYISLDIDGTVADYPRHWLQYLNTKLESSFSKTSEARQSLGVRMYEKLKSEWRNGPEYEIPIREEMKTLTSKVYSEGFDIVISTRRPLEKFPNMQDQISRWLLKNDLPQECVQKKTLENFVRFKVLCHIDDEYSEIFAHLNGEFPKKFIWLNDCNFDKETDLAKEQKLHLACIHEILEVLEKIVLKNPEMP